MAHPPSMGRARIVSERNPKVTDGLIIEAKEVGGWLLE